MMTFSPPVECIGTWSTMKASQQEWSFQVNTSSISPWSMSQVHGILSNRILLSSSRCHSRLPFLKQLIFFLDNIEDWGTSFSSGLPFCNLHVENRGVWIIFSLKPKPVRLERVVYRIIPALPFHPRSKCYDWCYTKYLPVFFIVRPLM